jgi:hypothetical protein
MQNPALDKGRYFRQDSGRGTTSEINVSDRYSKAWAGPVKELETSVAGDRADRRLIPCAVAGFSQGKNRDHGPDGKNHHTQYYRNGGGERKNISGITGSY